MKNTAALILSLSLAGSTLEAQEPAITSLLSRDLAGNPKKELLMKEKGAPIKAARGGHSFH